MMDRIIFLGTGIDDQVANIVTAQLLFLESSDPSKDIQIYINSPTWKCLRWFDFDTRCNHQTRCRSTISEMTKYGSRFISCW